MDTGLAAQTVGVPQGTLVHFVGEVDVATVGDFRAALHSGIRPHTTVIADLADVTFLSLAGARELCDAHHQLTAMGGRLVVWRPHRSSEHTLRVTALDGNLLVHRDPLVALV
jgi:anti-anti-sigma factor